MLGDDGLERLAEEAGLLEADGSLETGIEEVLGRLAGEEGFLTEEGLRWLVYSYSLKSLLSFADYESEEELSESAENARNSVRSSFEGSVYSYDSDEEVEAWALYDSDEEIKAWAFYERAEAEWWKDQYDVNDVSTPLGAFCWAVLHVRNAVRYQDDKVKPEDAVNLRVWHLEREAAERGLDLPWERGPVDGNFVVRRALLEVTAPGVRGVVFGPGLPPVLRPGAEGLFGFYDELLAAPVYRVRPTVEELSGYRHVGDLTEEGIVQIWPEEFEIELPDEIWERLVEVVRAFLRDDEARGILNAECKQRPLSEKVERSCPDWVTEAVFACAASEYLVEWYNIISCPIFTGEEVVEAGGPLAEGGDPRGGCVLLDEEALRDYILDSGGDEDEVEEILWIFEDE